MDGAEAKKKLNEQRVKRNKADWAKVLSMPEGRRVLYGILCEICGDMCSAFDAGNAHKTAYLNGKRDVADSIRLTIKRSKREALFQMEDEYKSDTAAAQEKINEINRED